MLTMTVKRVVHAQNGCARRLVLAERVIRRYRQVFARAGKPAERGRVITIKILWHGVAPWVPTGYGQQTALWVPLLASLGHEVVISSFHGLQGSPMQWGKHVVLPDSQHPYGADIIAARMEREECDLTITLMDQFALEGKFPSGLNVAHWMPVDCESFLNGAGRLDILTLQASGAMPIAISRHGEEMLKRSGFSPLYVPHGIDMKTFQRSERAREEGRKAEQLKGKFLIGINANNKDPYRKGMAEQLAAFARLHEKYEDTHLLLHCTMAEPNSVSLGPLIAELGLNEATTVADQYSLLSGIIEPEYLAIWYSCLDLYSCCSYAEGFGLTILEAQACGTPVVVTDFGSMAELCGAGWKVPGQKWWNWNHEAWWWRPSEDGIFRAYEAAYQRGPGYQRKCARAREFASRYSAERVLEDYWKPALKVLEEEIYIVRADGLKWDISGGMPGTSSDLIGPSHEQNLTANVLSLLPEGGVLLDVGAHVGHYTLRAAEKASKVIAVEPNPDTVAHLHRNLELNGITNVRVIDKAAWDGPVTLEAFSPNDLIRDGSMRMLEAGDGKIEGVALDTLLGDEPRIDLLKLDVEGADLHALRGLRETIDRCQPRMFVEDHSIYDYYSQYDLIALIKSFGYSVHNGGHYGGANYFVCLPPGEAHQTVPERQAGRA